MGGIRHGVKSLFLLIFRGSGFGQLTGPRERDVARDCRIDGGGLKVERSRSRIHLCRIDK